ncbi:hypothetical protein LG201_05730 [Methylobacillus gramineus]|uniref:hypothetical protein n=1 Tax=Methylobacillus gramineus TaxID=755169 RepID=UPI001CFFAF52|nr:hypothetical protein [Methylobacillus gramineus]MCB5184698.1 hypothetical protein [Methylobacillus gramineus]
MSNLSVLERLEESFAAFQRDEVSRHDFLRFLNISIEALEGVPYGVREELRKHEKDIETEGYFEEEGFESKLPQAKAALARWLTSLKKLYAQENF